MSDVHLFRVALVAVLCQALFGCQPRAPLHEAEYFVFGTQVSVSLITDEAELAHEAFSRLQQRFQGLHQHLHAWEPSALTHLNAAFAEGRSLPADPELAALIGHSQVLESDTGGRFNPAAGALIAAWGFHTSEYPVSSPPPPESFLRRWPETVPSTTSINLEGGLLSSRDPSVQLDFGAIAKGFAVDQAIELLRGLGIEDALVNAGGDLRAIGQHHERPWRIAVENPLTGKLITVIETDGNTAVFTSGGQYRYRQTAADEARWPHIIDPRTGYPATASLAVTVVAETGVVADAWATALYVETGPQDLLKTQLQRIIRVDIDGAVTDQFVRASPADSISVN